MSSFPEDFVLQSNSNIPYAGYCCALYSLHSVQIFINFADKVESIVDPDQLAYEKLVDFDLHCFQNRLDAFCIFGLQFKL